MEQVLNELNRTLEEIEANIAKLQQQINQFNESLNMTRGGINLITNLRTQGFELYNTNDSVAIPKDSAAAQDPTGEHEIVPAQPVNPVA